MRPSLALLLPALLSACAEREHAFPVRTTMADGQVLMGLVDTPVLLLEGGLGTLAIPWEDVGEVLPVEGAALEGSGGFVDVSLRNGSELTGRWADAQLAMELEVGGGAVAVDVPVDDLLHLQTQGGELWPEGTVYRVRTVHGDDFLVDPDATRLAITNGMGRFEPFLSECVSAAPIGEATGPWRVELVTGTVLVGTPVDGALKVRLPLGPEEATVPLTELVSLTRQDWSSVQQAQGLDLRDRLLPALMINRAPARPALPEEAAEVDSLGYVDSPVAGAGTTEDQAPRAAPATAPASPAGWFRGDQIRYTKQQLQ